MVARIPHFVLNADRMTEEPKPRAAHNDSPSQAKTGDPAVARPEAALPCWPFPPGSQNHTDKAVKLKPYVVPKRRTLNQY